jgi:hypothetical protein
LAVAAAAARLVYVGAPKLAAPDAASEGRVDKHDGDTDHRVCQLRYDDPVQSITTTTTAAGASGTVARVSLH